MGKLTELEQWEDDVYQIETSDPVLGGPEGVSNRPQKQLANRTQWLKKQLEDANNALAEHVRSRNHPDATLTAKGFVRLYSGVTSLDETMAATPKAVKIAMDNASERLAKARNLSDLQSVPQALQALTIATTKKAVEDTQIGLDRQPVMLISTADDLSNLPAGARRFARNNTGVTVLPTDNNCYIEVLAKRDTNNGTCIQVVEHNNPGNEWTGTRGDTMTETSFTWVRQYNESHRPPQQVLPDMPDALIRGNNLSDLTDAPEAVKYLGLTETVNQAAGAMQRDQNGADIPDKPLFVKTLGIVDSYPVGCPIPYPGPTAPNGYLLMDGRPFSKTLYPQLANLYVDGVLPDMRGMYVRGWDNGRSLDKGNYIGNFQEAPQNGAPHSTGLLAGGPPGWSTGWLYPSYGKYTPPNKMPFDYYSPRGYKCEINFGAISSMTGMYTPITFKEGTRGLLSEQYFESAFSKGLIESPATKYDSYKFKEMDGAYYTSVYTYGGSSGVLSSNLLAIGIGFGGSGRDAFATDFSPFSLNKAGVLPTGVPNVAFNYITKAA
ncbi:TPA: tail fiber protein [Salmonella enterica subsp. enterica serovar Muenchen]